MVSSVIYTPDNTLTLTNTAGVLKTTSGSSGNSDSKHKSVFLTLLPHSFAQRGGCTGKGKISLQ